MILYKLKEIKCVLKILKCSIINLEKFKITGINAIMNRC